VCILEGRDDRGPGKDEDHYSGEHVELHDDSTVSMLGRSVCVP
jgi:hypothetical protein